MNKRILVADDNDDIRNMLETILRDAGYSVDSASCGEVAVEKFKKARSGGSPYDLLLLDAAMPDLTGYEVTESVRELDKDVPVLLFTGHGESLTEPHAKAVGATKVLIKPLSGETLKAEVADAFAQSQKE